jgi:hypothetical protein
MPVHAHGSVWTPKMYPYGPSKKLLSEAHRLGGLFKPLVKLFIGTG